MLMAFCPPVYIAQNTVFPVLLHESGLENKLSIPCTNCDTLDVSSCHF
jgi:hypothetical protein